MGITQLEKMLRVLDESVNAVKNCRVDDQYNEDFLPENEKYDLRGYDWCAEMGADSFFDHTDEYFDDIPLLKALFKSGLPEDMKTKYALSGAFQGKEERNVNTYGDLIRYAMLRHLEAERNELIESILSALDNGEYEKLRQIALEKNAQSKEPKEYYDSVHYAQTGEKRFREEV